MHLVFLALEPAEEPLDPFVPAPSPSITNGVLVVGQLRPRHVQPHAARLGRALQLGQLRAVVRLAPRLDRVLLDRLRRIGHDEVHVQLDDVAEAVADRAGAERVVEREQPRLRHLVLDVAGPALEPLAEAVDDRLAVGRSCDRERRAAAFRVGGLDRVGQPRAEIAVDLQAIDDHLQRRPIRRVAGSTSSSVHRLAIDVAAGRNPCAASAASVSAIGVDEARQGRLRRATPHRPPVSASASSSSVALARAAASEAGTTGISKPMSSRVPAGSCAERRRPRPRRSRGSLPCRTAGRRSGRRGRTAGAGSRESRWSSRPSIAGCGCCSSGGSRSPGRCPRWIDVGLLHPLEELPGVGRQRLDVAPLALRRKSCRRPATTCRSR